MYVISYDDKSPGKQTRARDYELEWYIFGLFRWSPKIYGALEVGLAIIARGWNTTIRYSETLSRICISAGDFRADKDDFVAAKIPRKGFRWQSPLCSAIACPKRPYTTIHPCFPFDGQFSITVRPVIRNEIRMYPFSYTRWNRLRWTEMYVRYVNELTVNDFFTKRVRYFGTETRLKILLLP